MSAILRNAGDCGLTYTLTGYDTVFINGCNALVGGAPGYILVCCFFRFNTNLDFILFTLIDNRFFTFKNNFSYRNFYCYFNFILNRIS